MKLKKIFKYRDWEDIYHKKILTENQIYLASPKDFNDPFDCRINTNFSAMTLEEENAYILNLAITRKHIVEEKGLNLANVVKDFKERLSDKKQFQKFADYKLYNYQNESYAIFSCSLKWNNFIMWANYANYHRGFCVGFWVDKMKDEEIFGKLGKVKYQINYPLIKPRVSKNDSQLIDESFIETHTKCKDWKYECEYRLMSNRFPKILSIEDRQVTIPDEYFAEVILGINMPENSRIEIIEICRKKNIPVYQAEKVDYKFKINKTLTAHETLP